jgi:hypothetical protein
MRLFEIEDHVLGERRCTIVVVRRINRLLARELRAVAPLLIGDEGADGELQPAEIGAAAAMDRPVRRTPTAALAMGKLADDLFLAFIDLLLTQIDRRLEPRCSGRSPSELTSGDEECAGDEAGAGDGGAQISHNPSLLPRFM